MNWHLSIFCLVLSLQLTLSQYSKLSYVEVFSPITGIANCRTSNNAIYTTLNNKINLWVPADQKTLSYDLSISMNESTRHYLECSKYGSDLDNAYVAVLDTYGHLSVWEEVSTAFSLYLYNIGFKVNRTNATITDISVGQRFLALGYKNEKIIDVYNLGQRDNPPVTIHTKNNWRNIKMDILGNLALLTEVGQKIMFQYYTFTQNRSVVYQELTVQTDLLLNQPSNIDYQWAPEDQIRLRFLISGVTKSGMIQLYYHSRLSQYNLIFNYYNQILRLCDEKITYIEGKQVIKPFDGSIIKTDYPIDRYACTTDTGKYLYSQFYVVSTVNNKYYIDCFYDGNTVLEFIVWACFVCCCFWIRLCAQTGCNTCNACRDLGPCLSFLFSLFCWCPTQRNINKIQDSLQY